MDIKIARAPSGDYLFKAGPLTEGELLARSWVATRFAGPIEPDPRFAAGTATDSDALGALGSAVRSLCRAIRSNSPEASLPGRLATWRARASAEPLDATRPARPAR